MTRRSPNKELESDDQLVQALVSYLPPAVARAIHADPRAMDEPRAGHFPAAVLLADVSGFTALTEKLAARGPAGAEELTLLLNSYFSRMIALLEDEGGEVVQFSGDALIAVFPADPQDRESTDDQRPTTNGEPGDERQETSDERQSAIYNLQSAIDNGLRTTDNGPLAASVRRAWQAATRMQDSMAGFATLSTSVGSVALGMKIAIGAGEVLALSVGGVLKRWQYIIAGEPLRQVAEAEHIAQRGQIVLSPEAQALFSQQPLAPRPRVPLVWRDIGAETIAALRTHIPGAITYRLMAGQADWLAEMRRMTILFLGIGGLRYTGPEALEQIHATMIAFQGTVYRYEGSINKLLVDDKGAISIVLFGAPPMSHLDDPLRAVRCALDLQHAAGLLGLGLAIGITTGQVFAGPVGSDTRREYTVMGDAVNLAARLMQLAGRGGVLVDHTTYHATEAEIAWRALPSQMVKGKAAAVRVYQPLGVQSTRSEVGPGRLLVGRAAEMARIGELLDQSVAGQLRVLCLEGDPGIGKSRLVAELVERMRERGFAGMLGSGQAIEQQTPYRAWQDIFRTYFDLEGQPDHAAERRQVQERLAEIAPELRERAPLLNDLLGLGLPETSLTEQLEPKLRQDSLLALLIDLLCLWAAERPLVLVLEDAHWLDSLSWQLALQMARGLTDLPVLLVLALHEQADLPPDHPYRALRQLPYSAQLVLEPLSQAETIELVAARLEVAALPPTLTALIEQRAGGNPFVAEELALSLRDSGAIKVVDGQCVLATDVSELRLPDTVQGLVLSRIDRLPAGEQLTIKVASVMGREFGYPTLRDVYPARIAEARLQAHLDLLTERNMVLPLEDHGSLRSHTFKQAITQEVTYGTLLQAQRRDLHQRVARWYELRPAEDQPDLYPLLVYHWRQAGDHERELRYAILASKKFFAEYANREALSYIDRALRLSDDPRTQYDLLILRVQVHERIGDREAQRGDLVQLQALADLRGDSLALAQVSNLCAAYYRDISDYPAAIAALQRARAILHDAPDPAAEARSLTIWGQVMEYQGAFQEAKGYFEQALEIYRSMGYRRGEANNLNNLGNIHHYLGDELTSREYYRQALAIRRAIGDRSGEATSLSNLSQASLQLSDVAAAREYQRQALQIAHEIGDRSGEALGLSIIGHIYLVQGDYAAAKHHLEQGVRLFQNIGDRRREAATLNTLGQMWRDVGDYDSARPCFEQALAIQQEVGDHNWATYTYLNLGSVLLSHNKAMASECYQKALDFAKSIGNREVEAYALSYRAGLCEQQADWDAAMADHQAALAIWNELQNNSCAIEDTAGLARVAFARGDLEAARRHADICVAHLDAHGVEGMEFPLLVYLTCYDIVRAAGDQATATRLLDAGFDLLMQRADAISDPAMRDGLLHKIAINRRVTEEWGARNRSAIR